MPAPSAYNEKYHDDWAWSLALKGATDAEIAGAFGISARTLHRWKKAYPSLKEKLMEGKDIADAKVERCLYERALGYDAKDIEQYIENDKATGRQIVGRTRVTTKHIPADVGAICFWLKNRRPDMWRDRHELTTSVIDDSTRAAVEEFAKYGLTGSENADKASG